MPLPRRSMALGQPRSMVSCRSRSTNRHVVFPEPFAPVRTDTPSGIVQSRVRTARKLRAWIRNDMRRPFIRKARRSAKRDKRGRRRGPPHAPRTGPSRAFGSEVSWGGGEAPDETSPVSPGGPRPSKIASEVSIGRFLPSKIASEVSFQRFLSSVASSEVSPEDSRLWASLPKSR